MAAAATPCPSQLRACVARNRPPRLAERRPPHGPQGIPGRARQPEALGSGPAPPRRRRAVPLPPGTRGPVRSGRKRLREGLTGDAGVEELGDAPPRLHPLCREAAAALLAQRNCPQGPGPLGILRPASDGPGGGRRGRVRLWHRPRSLGPPWVARPSRRAFRDSCSRDWRLVRRLELVRGGALFLLITVPWHVLVARENPGFLWFYLVNEHFLRFLGHRELVNYASLPASTYLAMTLVWFCPWSIFLPAALRRCWPRTLSGGRAERGSLLILLWAGAVIGFFALSRMRRD